MLTFEEIEDKAIMIIDNIAMLKNDNSIYPLRIYDLEDINHYADFKYIKDIKSFNMEYSTFSCESRMYQMLFYLERNAKFIYPFVKKDIEEYERKKKEDSKARYKIIIPMLQKALDINDKEMKIIIKKHDIKNHIYCLYDYFYTNKLSDEKIVNCLIEHIIIEDDEDDINEGNPVMVMKVSVKK